jgi:hypothetical protein
MEYGVPLLYQVATPSTGSQEFFEASSAREIPFTYIWVSHKPQFFTWVSEFIIVWLVDQKPKSCQLPAPGRILRIVPLLLIAE